MGCRGGWGDESRILDEREEFDRLVGGVFGRSSRWWEWVEVGKREAAEELERQ